MNKRSDIENRLKNLTNKKSSLEREKKILLNQNLTLLNKEKRKKRAHKAIMRGLLLENKNVNLWDEPP